MSVCPSHADLVELATLAKGHRTPVINVVVTHLGRGTYRRWRRELERPAGPVVCESNHRSAEPYNRYTGKWVSS